MSTSARVPHLLTPYLNVSAPAQLILITQILGVSANWLLLQYIHFHLASHSANAVVFVSFSQDWDFWKISSRRTGPALDKALNEGRLKFGDGCTDPTMVKRPANSTSTLNRFMIPSLRLDTIETAIRSAIGDFRGGERVLLILDGLDMVLAAGAHLVQDVLDMELELRQKVHACIVTAHADYPLVQSKATPLENSHAAFVTSLLHEAQSVLSLRLLDSGTAKDVTGVLQINRAGGADDSSPGEELEEREFLYFVERDDSVRVFNRGS